MWHVCRRRRQAGSALSAEEMQRAQSGFQDSLLLPSLPSRVPSPASYAYQVLEWFHLRSTRHIASPSFSTPVVLVIAYALLEMQTGSPALDFPADHMHRIVQGMFAPEVALGMPVGSMQGSGPMAMSSMDQALMQMGHPAGPAPASHMYAFDQSGGLQGTGSTLSSHMAVQVSPPSNSRWSHE